MHDMPSMREPRICHQGGRGIFLPFDPESENAGHDPDKTDIVRAIVYTIGLGWLFMGVAISSDVFMSGIESITSQKMRVKHPTDPSRMVEYIVFFGTRDILDSTRRVRSFQ